MSIVLFGIDDSGKPKAARFAKEQADLAIKAAGQLQLRTLAIIGPDLAEVAKRLPIGRIHGSGRNVVPSVSHDLYDKLLALAETAATGGAPPSPAEAENGTAAATAALPRHWDEISRGHLVIGLQERMEGWFEAIVEEQSADMLTLRWRDYPRERRIIRHRNSVGLLYRPLEPGQPKDKQAGVAKIRSHPRPVAQRPCLHRRPTGSIR